jgi:hypothetical protein
MRWWKRSRPEPQQWSPPDPIPDHDLVLAPGQRRWALESKAADQ